MSSKSTPHQDNGNCNEKAAKCLLFIAIVAACSVLVVVWMDGVPSPTFLYFVLSGNAVDSPTVYSKRRDVEGSTGNGVDMTVQSRFPGWRLKFGFEMEFDSNETTLATMPMFRHVNTVPSEAYEHVLGLVQSIVAPYEHNSNITHEFHPITRPLRNGHLKVINLRTALWTDPGGGGTWKVSSESVGQWMYSGFEVVSPPLHNSRTAEMVTAALWQSGLSAGYKSATHVHVDGGCLFRGQRKRLKQLAPAYLIVRLILLQERIEPLIRRMFGTRHNNGSLNFFSASIGEVHPRLLKNMAKEVCWHVKRPSRRCRPPRITVAQLESMFDRFLPQELRHVRLRSNMLSIVRVNRTTAAIGAAIGTEGNDANDANATRRWNEADYYVKRAWKYHSLNLSRLLRLSTAFSPTGTVEFRAFDLLPPRTLRLAINMCRAVVAKVWASAHAYDNSWLPSQPELASLRAPFTSSAAGRNGKEMAVDLLPEDPAAVRQMARSLIIWLGLDPFDYFALISEIKQETSVGWWAGSQAGSGA